MLQLLEEGVDYSGYYYDENTKRMYTLTELHQEDKIVATYLDKEYQMKTEFLTPNDLKRMVRVSD